MQTLIRTSTPGLFGTAVALDGDTLVVGADPESPTQPGEAYVYRWNGAAWVEAQTLAEVDEALASGADIILADNMSTADVRETVARTRGRAKVEISGGVTLERIQELGATGADYVSVGALTHSAAAVDISFEIEPI